MKRANIRDSVAVIELAAELEEGMAKGEEWTELKTVQRLQHLRSKQMHNRFHIFPEAQVTVNKNAHSVRHHFLAQVSTWFDPFCSES